MNHKKCLAKIWIVTFTMALISVLLLTSLFVPVSQAGNSLPDRNTPTPVRPDDTDDENDGTPVGGFIELRVQSTRTGLWTIVQWQDSTGTWQIVEGWQGALNENGGKRWWVSAKEFGKGPFRWVVYKGQGGRLLAASESFDLPDEINDTTIILIALPQ